MVMSKLASTRDTVLNESEGSGERLTGSIRSSDGGGSFSGCEDYGTAEKARIEFKMDQIKERIARISLAREGEKFLGEKPYRKPNVLLLWIVRGYLKGKYLYHDFFIRLCMRCSFLADVVDFLSMTSNLKGGQENPQIVRVRQHFEKKNKKYAQETEHLQKKLEQLEMKLAEIEKGVTVEPSSKNAMLSNIRYALSSNQAHSLKCEVSSAPNMLPHEVELPIMFLEPASSEEKSKDSSQRASGIGSDIQELQNEFKDFRSQNQILVEQLNKLQAEAVAANVRIMVREISQKKRSYFSVKTSERLSVAEAGNGSALSRIRKHFGLESMILNTAASKCAGVRPSFLQLILIVVGERWIRNTLADECQMRLEELLNESIELHQAEMTSLKSDLNTIGTRMDYQYCERFRAIEESIESTENKVRFLLHVDYELFKVIRVENSMKEWVETRPQSLFGPVLLSAANILVELLKLILFIISVALDFVKPLTGTR
ncbi:unnamed protein product [Enterobius vermicularis]|uniref:DUF4477 domain-containing protein n=1 Tax=Enterobius vermicularis TaxID=51028 RepID=A0A158Q9A1_ENTVE|nr:unnamed protein product [Enterobius vermicularis]